MNYIVAAGYTFARQRIRRHLRANGIVRLKVKRRPYVAAQAGRRYGYGDAHRRENVAPCRTNLTDAEWEPISDLFEHDAAKQGAPPRYSRRDLINACGYVLRTGCSWRLLPNSFAPWQAVYKAFARRVEAGTFGMASRTYRVSSPDRGDSRDNVRHDARPPRQGTSGTAEMKAEALT